MMTACPRGVTIFRHTKREGSKYNGPALVCTIRARGRTGANIRSRLMRMTVPQREPILEAWLAGQVVEL